MSTIDVEVRLPVAAIAELDRLADGLGMSREEMDARIVKTYVERRMRELTPADRHGFEPFELTERN